MRMIIDAALVAAVFSFSFAAHAAQPLLAPSNRDQVVTRLVSLPAPAGEIERAPVSFVWKLDPAAAISQPDNYIAESREYWQTVEDSELQNGMQLRTTAPGAVIRISPARGAAALEAGAIRISSNGKPARIERAADAAALQAAGMDVDAGTTVIKLAGEHGGGTYALRAANARGRYLVHVFEPDSDVVLKAQADRHHVLSGDTIGVALDFTQAGRVVPAQAQALLVAPDGSSHPAAVARTAQGTLQARVKLPAQASTTPGLWELQLFADGEGISRDARTAFAVSAPTARLSGNASVDASRLRVAVPIESASPGRYELRGTLYATKADGTIAPVSQAHSAAWFERGKGSLVIAFDRAHVPSGFGAPFEIRDLELNDQSRQSPLETRSRALRF